MYNDNFKLDTKLEHDDYFDEILYDPNDTVGDIIEDIVVNMVEETEIVTKPKPKYPKEETIGFRGVHIPISLYNILMQNSWDEEQECCNEDTPCDCPEKDQEQMCTKCVFHYECHCECRVDFAGFRCVDCNVRTDEIDEYYMVEEEIWAESKLDPDEGMLCITCLENRIGRNLVPMNFTNAPLNMMRSSSELLESRKGDRFNKYH